MTRLSSTGAFDYYPPVPAGIDCTASLQEAIQRTQVIDGRLVLGPGDYRTSAPIDVPSGMTIIGPGARILATGDYAAVRFINTDGSKPANILIDGVCCAHTNTAGSPVVAQTNSYGFLVWGDDCTLRNCCAEDCYVGVITDETRGNGDPTTRLVLDNVKVTHSNALLNTCLWGFQLDFVDGLTARNCYAYDQWLDGFKIRRETSNVEIYGGEFSRNGVSTAGDGIDTFAGGSHFKIFGTVCNENNGGGINVKSGDLNVAGAWGYINFIDIVGVTCKSNTGIGLQLNRSTATNPTTEPLAAHVSITGGVYENNGTHGLYIRGCNVTITNPIVYGNVDHGFVLTPECMDVTVHGGLYVANGSAGVGYGNVYVTGLRSHLVGCIAIGKGSPDITRDADYAGLPAISSFGFVLANTADGCVLTRCTGHSFGSSLYGVQGAFGARTVQIHAQGAGAPVIPGSPGSTYSRTDGGAGTSFYVKEAGPVENTAGWVGK